MDDKILSIKSVTEFTKLILFRSVLESTPKCLHKMPGACHIHIHRDLKFRIYEVEGLYYLCSGNKSADQLRSYHKPDLHLCFGICKKQVFS